MLQRLRLRCHQSSYNDQIVVTGVRQRSPPVYRLSAYITHQIQVGQVENGELSRRPGEVDVDRVVVGQSVPIRLEEFIAQIVEALS
jgi:hypothetical protein